MSTLASRLAPIALTLLVACGGAPSAPAPGDGTPPGSSLDPADCAVIIPPATSITVPTRLVNSPAACDYRVDGTLSVTSVLQIEPGTVVEFAQDSEFYIGEGGVLDAVGTPNARIKLIGANKTKGYWDGIDFNGARPSRIEYTDIESAGQTGPYKNHAGVSGVDGDLSFENNTVSGSYANGMIISALSRLHISAFAGNVFYDNVGYGLAVSTQQTTILDAASDYSGQSQGKPNGLPYVKLDWDDTYDSTTLHRLNAPYFVDIAVYYKGGLLTVEPGVKIVMNDGAAFNLHDGGAMRAVGTASQPIVFTGKTEKQGAWDGLDFFYSPSAQNLLDHVQVLYGGGEGANVYVGNGSYLKIQNSLLAHSGGAGVCLDSIDSGNAQASVDIGAGMTYQDNAGSNENLNCGN